MSFLTTLAQYSQYDDPSYYTTSSQLTEGQAAAIAGGTLLFMFIFILIGYVVTAFLLSRIFKKAGVEPWKAWVPIYNTWVMLELGGQKGFWAVLALVPIVNIAAVVFMYIAYYHIGLKFGKSGAFVLLAIFLPIVWLIWLAFDSSTWNGQPSMATAGATPTPGQPTVPSQPISTPASPAAPSGNNQQPPQTPTV